MGGILPLCVARGKLAAMPSIPHSFSTALSAYAAPLAALLVALTLPLGLRGKSWVAVAGPFALFAGWALLLPLARLPGAVWAPHRGPETLLTPALASVVGVALLALRGGRPLLWAGATSAFAGWWMAHASVGAGDFWRVWVGIGALAWLVSRVVQGRPDRLLIVAGALWGGLAVAGAPPAWLAAALVVAAAGAGLAAVGGEAAVSAALAALIGGIALAGGKLIQGRIGLVDVACGVAMAAPLLADWASGRFGSLPARVAAVLSRVAGATVAVGIVWVVRRVFFT